MLRPYKNTRDNEKEGAVRKPPLLIFIYEYSGIIIPKFFLEEGERYAAPFVVFSGGAL